VLARVLGPEQLGLAATLTLTSSFFELATDTGGDRFLIQAHDGDQPSVQGLVQLAQVGRGVLIAALLVVFAWPISLLYRVPELFGPLAALALPQLIAGFVHLDMRRAQRQLDFRTEGWALLASETASLITTIAVALATHSFTAILYGLIVRAAMAVAVSHLRRERRYTIRFERAHLEELARFSAPLMLTGLLVFMAQQSDRAIIGAMLGVKDLGLYSAVILLIYYPSFTLLRFLNSMYLPLVSSGRTTAERREAAELLGGQSILLAILMSTGFTIAMPVVVPFLYGGRFGQPVLTFALVGVLQSSRFLMLWPYTVATGDGRSTVVLATNIARLSAVPAAILGGLVFHQLEGVVAGFILGEWVAVACGVAMTRRLSGHGLGAAATRLAAFGAASLLLIAWPLAPPETERVLVSASVVLLWWILRRESATLRQSVQVFGRLVRGGAAHPPMPPPEPGASPLQQS
jgi:O-antigen/teichoic acid export membrane protein